MFPKKSINEQMIVYAMFLMVSVIVMLSIASIREWVGIVILLSCCPYIYVKMFSKFIAKLPGKSMYRYFGIIEVHIGKKGKTKRGFYRILAKSILVGQKRNAKVVFYTWTITSDRAREFLGGNVEIEEAKGYERFAQIFLNSFYKDSSDKKPLIKVTIDTKMISNSQLLFLKRWAR